MTRVRVIHGEGADTLRRVVHGLLDPTVEHYMLDDRNWGATLVAIKPAPR